MKEKKIQLSLRLNAEESEKLRQNAAACGLSQSEYLRQLCNGSIPKTQPKTSFWKLMNELYQLHDALKKSENYTVDAAEGCRLIEALILDLQAECTLPEPIFRSETDGLEEVLWQQQASGTSKEV